MWVGLINDPEGGFKVSKDVFYANDEDTCRDLCDKRVEELMDIAMTAFPPYRESASRRESAVVLDGYEEIKEIIAFYALLVDDIMHTSWRVFHKRIDGSPKWLYIGYKGPDGDPTIASVTDQKELDQLVEEDFGEIYGRVPLGAGTTKILTREGGVLGKVCILERKYKRT